MEDSTAERSLLQWIQSFEDDLAHPTVITSLDDLVDGVFLARLMHHIDPDSINLDLINVHGDGNWALAAGNLKALLRAIENFYRDELNQICDASEIIDSTRIARDRDTAEVGRLVELILGCAVQGPSKSEYIHPIMQMDASEQASMMHMIENIMHRFAIASPSGGHGGHHGGAGSASTGAHHRESAGNSSFGYLNHEGESDESLHLQLTQALEKISMMELRCLDMERDKRELTERLENVVSEKQTLATKLTTLEGERDKLLSERQSTLTRDNKKIQQIVEGEIHALSVQLEEKNEELARVKRESSERLIVLENEVRRQADELDISRSKIAQLGKLEASVAKYKKKLEEMNTLKTQVHDLETHNAQYLDKVLDLESTVKTIPALKALVEKYKNQVVELETANVEVASSNHIKEQKIRRLQEELDSAMGGKEFLENQVDELRNQIASLHHHQGRDDDETYGSPNGVSSHSLGAGRYGDGVNGEDGDSGSLTSGLGGSRSGASGGGFSADFVLGSDSVPSLRERIARLERENKELKRGGDNSEHSHLANELDLALKAKEALQSTLFELKRQNEQLNEEMEALRQSGVPGSNAESSTPSPTKPSAATLEKINEYETEISRLRAEVESIESMRATVTELTNRLKDKESIINEVSEQRAKLENYTKKTLHAVQTKYMVAVSSHRNQVNEKQERIDFLEKKLKEMRASYSREQALMMSAFYEIGTEMQRRTMMPQTPGQGPQPAAWLASKRTEERAKRRQV